MTESPIKIDVSRKHRATSERSSEPGPTYGICHAASGLTLKVIVMKIRGQNVKKEILNFG